MRTPERIRIRSPLVCSDCSRSRRPRRPIPPERLGNPARRGRATATPTRSSRSRRRASRSCATRCAARSTRRPRCSSDTARDLSADPSRAPKDQTRRVIVKHRRRRPILHTSIDLPMMFSDRDIVTRGVRSADPKTGIRRIDFKSIEHPSAPPREGFIRLQNTGGFWEFVPDGDEALEGHLRDLRRPRRLAAGLARLGDDGEQRDRQLRRRRERGGREVAAPFGDRGVCALALLLALFVGQALSFRPRPRSRSAPRRVPTIGRTEAASPTCADCTCCSHGARAARRERERPRCRTPRISAPCGRRSAAPAHRRGARATSSTSPDSLA